MLAMTTLRASVRGGHRLHRRDPLRLPRGAGRWCGAPRCSAEQGGDVKLAGLSPYLFAIFRSAGADDAFDYFRLGRRRGCVLRLAACSLWRVTSSRSCTRLCSARRRCALLEPSEGRLIIDGTLGGGGHTEALLEAGATVLGVDRDPARPRGGHGAPRALRSTLPRRAGRLRRRGRAGRPARSTGSCSISASARRSSTWPRAASASRTTGRSTCACRGDGRDRRRAHRAARGRDELADVLYQLRRGAPLSRHRARAQGPRCRRPPSRRCAAVKAGVPRKAWPKDINVATRTFQALRIAVNDELEQLEARAGRVARAARSPAAGWRSSAFTRSKIALVKHAFRALCGEAPDDAPQGAAGGEGAAAGFRPLTQEAGDRLEAEAEPNPRARSAKLRGVEKVSAS